MDRFAPCTSPDKFRVFPHCYQPSAKDGLPVPISAPFDEKKRLLRSAIAPSVRVERLVVHNAAFHIRIVSFLLEVSVEHRSALEPAVPDLQTDAYAPTAVDLQTVAYHGL